MKLPPAVESLWTQDRFQLQFWADQLRDGSTAMVLLVLAGGILLLLYGRTVFRAAVMLNAAILAGYAGWRIGQETAKPWLVALGAGIVVGILAWPLFKVGVAVLCGFAGTALAVQVAPFLPKGQEFAPLYSLIGFIVFAVAGAFLLFFAITVFTAMEGSTMIILGALVLAERAGILAKGASWITLKEAGAVHIAIAVLGILGILYQWGVAGGRSPAPAAKS